MDKPAIFIGSASEALDDARQFQVTVEKMIDCEANVWDQGMFTPGLHSMEALEEEARRVDFAVLIATPEDWTESRGVGQLAPRDNVTFELGLFMGQMGVRRVFMLSPTGEAMKYPSDLLGITRLPNYGRNRADGRGEAGFTSAALQLKSRVKALGRRPRPAMVPAGSAPPPSRHQGWDQELETLLLHAEAQGWTVKRTASAVRLTDRQRQRHTFTIPVEDDEARRRLRPFIAKLRAHGLRVGNRLREPPTI